MSTLFYDFSYYIHFVVILSIMWLSGALGGSLVLSGALGGSLVLWVALWCSGWLSGALGGSLVL